MSKISIRCNKKTKLRLIEIINQSVMCPFDPRTSLDRKRDGKCAQCIYKDIKFIVTG